MNLNSKIENQKRGGKGDTLPSNDYYTNSYVERLKALGSNVQYSNYFGGSLASLTLLDGRVILSSVYIPKTAIVTNIGWIVGNVQGNYTADNYNGIGIYSINNTTGDLTLLGKTVNDDTIWSSVAAQGYANKNFTTPITLERGVYFLAYLYNNSAVVSAPTIYYPANSAFSISVNFSTINTPTNTYMAGFVSTQTDLTPIINKIDIDTSSASAAPSPIFYLS